jgi:hypothetical protein
MRKITTDEIIVWGLSSEFIRQKIVSINVVRLTLVT